MTMNLDAVIEISRVVAHQLDPAFEVLGVASTDGGSERVELLVTLAASHDQASVIMINVARAEPFRFAEDIREKLRDAIDARGCSRRF